jgi:hypothetical protein
LPFLFSFFSDYFFHFFLIFLRTVLANIAECLTRWVRPAAQQIRDDVVFSWDVADCDIESGKNLVPAGTTAYWSTGGI